MFMSQSYEKFKLNRQAQSSKSGWESKDQRIEWNIFTLSIEKVPILLKGFWEII